MEEITVSHHFYFASVSQFLHIEVLEAILIDEYVLFHFTRMSPFILYRNVRSCQQKFLGCGSVTRGPD